MHTPCVQCWSFSLSSENAAALQAAAWGKVGLSRGGQLDNWLLFFHLWRENWLKWKNMASALCIGWSILWRYWHKHFTKRMVFLAKTVRRSFSVCHSHNVFQAALKILEELELPYFSPPNLVLFLSFGWCRGLKMTSLSQLLRGHGCLVTCWWKSEIGKMEVLFEAPHP